MSRASPSYLLGLRPRPHACSRLLYILCLRQALNAFGTTRGKPLDPLFVQSLARSSQAPLLGRASLAQHSYLLGLRPKPQSCGRLYLFIMPAAGFTGASPQTPVLRTAYILYACSGHNAFGIRSCFARSALSIIGAPPQTPPCGAM